MKGEKNMGKKYKKPRVMFENLEFNSAIAASCDFAYASNCMYVINQSADDLCVQMVERTENGRIYIGEVTCKNSQYCYHVSSGNIASNLVSGS